MPSIKLKSVLVLILCICLASILDAQTITFKFNPPDHFESTDTIKITEIYTTTAISSNDSVRIVSETYQVSKYSIEKTDTGTIITDVLISSDTYVDGVKKDTALDAAYINQPLKYKLDQTGKLITIEGYKEIYDSLLNSKTESVYVDRFPAYMDYKTFLSSLSMEWNRKIGNYIGKSVEIGDSMIILDTTRYLTGKLITKTVTRFKGMTTCDGNECVLVEYDYTVNSDSLLKESESTLAKTLGYSGPERDAFKLEKIEYFGTGKSIIQPSTMLYFGDTENSMFIMYVVLPNGLKMILKEEEIREGKPTFPTKEY